MLENFAVFSKHFGEAVKTDNAALGRSMSGFGGSAGGQFGGAGLSQLVASSTPRKIETDIARTAKATEESVKLQRQTLDAVESSLTPTFT